MSGLTRTYRRAATVRTTAIVRDHKCKRCGSRRVAFGSNWCAGCLLVIEEEARGRRVKREPSP